MVCCCGHRPRHAKLARVVPSGVSLMGLSSVDGMETTSSSRMSILFGKTQEHYLIIGNILRLRTHRLADKPGCLRSASVVGRAKRPRTT